MVMMMMMVEHTYEQFYFSSYAQKPVHCSDRISFHLETLCAILFHQMFRFIFILLFGLYVSVSECEWV